MRKLLLIASFGLFSMNGFASLDFDKTEENLKYPEVHVYCDGEYAGSFYNLPSYSAADIVDMATSMCD